MSTSGNFIDGTWVETARTFAVHDKFTGDVIREVGLADAALTREAVGAAAAAFARESLTPYRRYEILSRAAHLMEQRRDAVVATMRAETGFTLSDCRNEFTRSLQTFALSAEEAKRIVGELVPIQGAPQQRDERLAFTIRMPLGVVCAITPFNAPLNTVLHKIGPALAAGNTVVLKPSAYTPLTAIAVCEVLAEAGLPAGFLNLIQGGGDDVGQQLLEDQRIEYYTFTGSTRVGRIIQQHAGLRRTQLELGSISSTIVCHDATLAPAADKCVAASFRKAGQVCTSIQRILVHASALDAFADLLAARTRALKVGDPRDPDTVVGPMIHEKEAIRAETWIKTAVADGAQVVVGGQRDGAVLQPTILRNVRPEMRVVCEEIFAPVISLIPFTDDEEAYALANATPFGLSVGLFTNDVTRALMSIRRLRMGSVHINDTSSSRVDLMPYGGVKASGFGHEGPRYAIRDMTEERLVTLNPI
ncbi:aldehyde dehydrogenase family protein [Reyranella sp. CPCC 100927]|uniref:aldehyde dehydrogenase family protein n=1 Tax=Reyranella sp. CPCC 100927 TaxID=2599616 RepID=UPI0011B35857|nr:aldehyde dehydrogenase family protein [Reyranella sp. CPCC 100927]TWS98473.1 aldehyde dehydrogenase family protein [Reyranella sp. CPCC 100927]